jgi:hypothetical protein
MSYHEHEFGEDFEGEYQRQPTEEEEQWYQQKSAIMESVLGQEYELVCHAIVPYAVGGALDLYYYPYGIPGTGIATKELCEVKGGGPSNDQYDNYEFVMFTRQPLPQNLEFQPEPFAAMHDSINLILNSMARYAEQAKLNAGDTCEFPADFEQLGGRCLILDAYGEQIEAGEFGLVLIMEVHRSEMEFARKNGAQALFDRLKAAGYYPYSDMDRPPVV